MYNLDCYVRMNDGQGCSDNDTDDVDYAKDTNTY